MNYNLRIHAFVLLRYMYSIRGSKPDKRTAVSVYAAVKNHPSVKFKSHISVRAALLTLEHVGLTKSVAGKVARNPGERARIWLLTDKGQQLIEDVKEFESPD